MLKHARQIVGSARRAISVATFGSVFHRKFVRLGDRNACLNLKEVMLEPPIGR
jgi:hypothetical protein